MDEEGCFDDSLLREVVQKAKEARQRVGGVYRDPEQAWIDAYVEAYNDMLFHQSPAESIHNDEMLCQVHKVLYRTLANPGEPLTEPLAILHRTLVNG